jgi:hypothetical protein
MLIKIVLDKQIRILSSKNMPTLDDLYQFITKTFLPTKNYVIYHLDYEGDHIIFETDVDIKRYL